MHQDLIAKAANFKDNLFHINSSCYNCFVVLIFKFAIIMKRSNRYVNYPIKFPILRYPVIYFMAFGKYIQFRTNKSSNPFLLLYITHPGSGEAQAFSFLRKQIISSFNPSLSIILQNVSRPNILFCKVRQVFFYVTHIFSNWFLTIKILILRLGFFL